MFRRREPLHVRLARDAGLSLASDPPPQPQEWESAAAVYGLAAIHGIHRPRRWDAVVTARAPGLEADRAQFVVLSYNERLFEGDPGRIEPLAHAIEATLAPPYRAEAVRREGDLWAVAARAIEVLDLPGVAGDEIELAAHDGERTLVVDGRPALGTIPALERPEHVVRAYRLRGEAWEVVVNPL